MHILARLAVAVALVASTLVLAPAPAALADVPSQGEVLFVDEFTTLNTDVWEEYSACSYDSTAAFGGIDCGIDATVSDGVLSIPATAPDTEHPNGQGSALRTKVFDFQYGTMTARMKMPAAPGSWPAFWSLNNDREGGNPAVGKAVGEVDAVESYTAFQDETIATAHSHTLSPGVTTHAAENHCPGGEGFDIGEWHDYGAKIEPTKVTFFVDGVQCGDPWNEPTSENAVWGFGEDRVADNWLILQHAVGGAGGQNVATGALGVVLVDRVEVRALDVESPAIVSSTTYKITNTCGGKVLGVSSSNIEQVKTQDWTGADTQKWTAITTTGSYFKIKNVSSGKTMNIAYSSSDNGAQVIQYTDNGGSNAEFTIAPGINGEYQISAHNSGKFLDVPGGSTAANVGLIQWGHSGTCAQRYVLTAL